MDAVHEVLTLSSVWVRGHLSVISTAITATLLVIFGDNINRFVKVRIRRFGFPVRIAVFIALCAFGYGALGVLIAPAITALLRFCGDRYLAATVLGAFLAMGILAERKRYM